MNLKPIDTSYDVAFAQTPERWPVFPVLPLKHQRDQDEDGSRQLGVIFAFEPTTVYIGCLGLTDFAALDAKRQHYPTTEAIFEDWLVD